MPDPYELCAVCHMRPCSRTCTKQAVPMRGYAPPPTDRALEEKLASRLQESLSEGEGHNESMRPRRGTPPGRRTKMGD